MTTPREVFEQMALDLGLTITGRGSDDWASGFLRADGLHLWCITHYRMGLGIQTAVIRDGRYVDHKPFYGDYPEALRQAAARPLPVATEA